jgi:hypothetical protein
MKALLAFVLLALAPSVAFAEAKDQMPKPGPEVRKLGYYVGTWKGHGETVASAFGPAGKLSSLQTCSWFAGNFHIVCRGEETGPTGVRQFLNIIGYDDKTKAYVQHSISSFGQTEDDQGGALTGNRLVFVLDGGDVGGKPSKFRYTEVHMTPVLYSYRAEISLDNGAKWTLIGQGEIAKVK